VRQKDVPIRWSFFCLRFLRAGRVAVVENAAFFIAPSAIIGVRLPAVADDVRTSALTVGLTGAKRQRTGANIERIIAMVCASGSSDFYRFMTCPTRCLPRAILDARRDSWSVGES